MLGRGPTRGRPRPTSTRGRCSWELRSPPVSTCTFCRWLARRSPKPTVAWAEPTPRRSGTAMASQRRFCRRSPENCCGGPPSRPIWRSRLVASRRWSDNSLGRLTCWPPRWMTTGGGRTIASTLGKTTGRSSRAGRARVRASRDLAPAPCWRDVSQDRRRRRCGTCRWLLRRVVNSDCPFRPKTQALVRQELSARLCAERRTRQLDIGDTSLCNQPRERATLSTLRN